MSLPFDIPDKNKRKYQCFVCGHKFNNYPEYKEHIIESHIEGREYVLCPLPRCGAPIRDVKMHFKVKHPKDAIPKKGQMSALVWKDVNPKGNVKTKKPNFKEGWYDSIKMSKKFYYRSGYEQVVYECLDVDDEVTGFEAEPFKIPYIFEGKPHKYTPDVLVTFADGHKELWEIKPANQTLLEQNKAKWFAAAEACKPRGWDFVVITEVGINKLKKKVQVKGM